MVASRQRARGKPYITVVASWFIYFCLILQGSDWNESKLEFKTWKKETSSFFPYKRKKTAALQKKSTRVGYTGPHYHNVSGIKFWQDSWGGCCAAATKAHVQSVLVLLTRVVPAYLKICPKVIHPKYSKHWPYTVAYTIDLCNVYAVKC